MARGAVDESRVDMRRTTRRSVLSVSVLHEHDGEHVYDVLPPTGDTLERGVCRVCGDRAEVKKNGMRVIRSSDGASVWGMVIDPVGKSVLKQKDNA